MLSVLILEDDMYTLRFLEKLISSHPLVDEVFATSDGNGATQIAEESNLDIAFLDIELSANDSCNGIDVAKILKAIHPCITLIFVTGYTHYALDCFSVHPYDYLVKPINKAKVINVITEAASLKQAPSVKNSIPKKHIAIKVEHKIVYVELEDIYFIEKIAKKAFIHTIDEVLTCNYGLFELAQILPDNFEKTHKSYIVNMNKVKSIENIGNQSFIIHFAGYDKTAYLSRYEYEKKQELFQSDLK